MPAPAPKVPRLRLLRSEQAAASPSISDEELADAIAEGDPDAGGPLYDRLIRVVDSTLYRVLGRRTSEHDDLVQNVFEQIVRTLREHRYRRACSLSSWAGAISCNVALNALRSQRRARRVFDYSTPAEAIHQVREHASDPADRADARAEYDRLRRALTEVRPEQAQAVVLHDLCGKNLSEISVLTSVSLAAAQSRLVRGRAALARRMAKLAEGGR